MLKTLEEKIISISSLKELKDWENKVLKKQIFEFKCTQCNSLIQRPLWRIIKQNYILMCKHCSQGFKSQQTKLKKYGNKNYNNSEKYKKTCLQKYGVENPKQLEFFKEKGKQTSLKKYGVENPAQNKKVKEKTKQTCLQKYGVSNPTYLPSHLEKTKKTSLKKYGTIYPIQSKKVREKATKSLKETFLKRTEEEWKEIRKKSSKKYNYQNYCFDSSWELALWIYAEDHNEKIEQEPCCFEYEFEGKKHKYFPDFKYKGQLIEIKGEQFFENLDPTKSMRNPFNKNQNQQFEAKHQCGLQHNVQFWSLQEITPYLDYINQTYGKDYLKQFKNQI